MNECIVKYNRNFYQNVVLYVIALFLNYYI